MKGSTLQAKRTDLFLEMNKKRNNYGELPVIVLIFSIRECQLYMSSYESGKTGRANKQKPTL
jgi:hypothetical protein